MIRHDHHELPDTMWVVEWMPTWGDVTTCDMSDPVFEANWLPTLGPTAFCAARYLLPRLGSPQQPAVVTLAELGEALGVRRTDVLRKSVNRLRLFGVATSTGQWFGLARTVPIDHNARQAAVRIARRAAEQAAA